MAYTDAQVRERANQILKEKGDTQEARAQIAREAKEAGVTAGQLSRSLGGDLTEKDVRRMAAEAGERFTGQSIGQRFAKGELTRDQVQELMDANTALALSPEDWAAKYVQQQIEDSGAEVTDFSQGDLASMFSQAFDALKYGMQGTRGLTGYRPRKVQAMTLPEIDISQYMNPYTQEVIDKTLADVERNRLIQQQTQAAQATAAGAFGGSRQGVAQALTNEAFARQAGNMASQLRQTGYTQAQQAAGTDLARQMQASLANQQAGLSAAQLQLGANQQLFNMGQGQYGLASGMEQQIYNDELARQQLQQGLLSAQQGQFQSFFGQPVQALGYLPGAISGMPYSQTTTAGMQPGLFDYLTLGAYAYGLSDERLKKDVEEIKTLDNGIKVVRWKWNDIGKKLADPSQPTYGVIAQQIAKIIPEAVKRHASGYLMVDYSHPELRGV